MNLRKPRLFIFLLFIFSFSAHSMDLKGLIIPENAIKKSKGKTILVVAKKEYLIYVLDKETKSILAQFPVSLGMNPGRKILRGDKKTPEGIYFIREILSDAQTIQSQSYQKLKQMNSIYWKASDGHYKYGKPDKDLGKNAYGPRVFKLDYPNSDDKELFSRLKKEQKIPANSQLEKWMGLHGTNDPESIQKNVSSGCIRLLNHDLILLGQYVEKGTMVIILPSGD